MTFATLLHKPSQSDAPCKIYDRGVNISQKSCPKTMDHCLKDLKLASTVFLKKTLINAFNFRGFYDSLKSTEACLLQRGTKWLSWYSRRTMCRKAIVLKAVVLTLILGLIMQGCSSAYETGRFIHMKKRCTENGLIRI